MDLDDNIASEDGAFSADECDRKCKTFADITGTDTALGHFFLQDCEWNLDTAVSRFFDSCPDLSTGVKSNEADSESAVDQFVILSWNIDGLDDKNRRSRIEAVCHLIIQEKPAIVFLQEIVAETLQILNVKLSPDYTIIAPSSQNFYFTGVLLRTKIVKQLAFKVITYENSVMLRDLLQVEVEIAQKHFVLLTTHLESTKEFKSVRKDQFRLCMEEMKQIPPSKCVIFGGDLNLSDDEVVNKPNDVFDVWEQLGSDPEQKFTWDCLQNDNLQIGRDENKSKFKPRCRFDRLYFRDAKPSTMELSNFELTGKQRIRSCLCFASDHWALKCFLKVKF